MTLGASGHWPGTQTGAGSTARKFSSHLSTKLLFLWTNGNFNSVWKGIRRAFRVNPGAERRKTQASKCLWYWRNNPESAEQGKTIRFCGGMSYSLVCDDTPRSQSQIYGAPASFHLSSCFTNYFPTQRHLTLVSSC